VVPAGVFPRSLVVAALLAGHAEPAGIRGQPRLFQNSDSGAAIPWR
jgi:hypothetical protein